MTARGRIVAAFGSAFVVAALAAGCGGGGSPDGSHSTAPPTAAQQQALAFSHCMRTHGVTRFPDLTSLIPLRGGMPKVSLRLQQLGVDSSQLQRAQTACRHLLPNGGQTTQTASQRDLDAMRGFARCMRGHGVPTWPDPTNGPAGWGFDLVDVHGFDPNSPQIENTMNGCQRHLPAGIGVPLSRPGRPG